MNVLSGCCAIQKSLHQFSFYGAKVDRDCQVNVKERGNLC